MHYSNYGWISLCVENSIFSTPFNLNSQSLFCKEFYLELKQRNQFLHESSKQPIFIRIRLKFLQAESFHGIDQFCEVLDTAGRPLVDLAVVIHHTADAGARLSLWIEAFVFRVVIEVVLHAEVVANLVSNSLYVMQIIIGWLLFNKIIFQRPRKETKMDTGT